MKNKRIALIGLGAGLLSISSESSQAATQDQVDAARNKAAAWLISQQKGDGNWSTGQGADVSVTAQATTGLLAAGIKGYPVNKAGAWLANADPQSVDALARLIRTKVVPFENLSTQHGKLLSWKSMSDRSLWGSYAHYGHSFTDSGLAIQATVPFSYSSQSSELLNAIYCNILPKQTAAGGWPQIPTWGSGGAPASASGGAVMPTVVTILALNAVRGKYGWDSNTCGTTYSITTAVQNAANWLLTQKNPDGGVGENANSTVFATALAYQGIRSARPSDTALPGLIDYLIGHQNANGSWGGEPMQTGLALEQLATVASPLTHSDGDGIPDAIETLLGTNPSVADTNSLAAKGNGNATAGSNVPLLVGTIATVGQAFSYGLTSPTGTAPFTWNLTGGSLPPGLTMSTGGVISGTPTQLGSYTFQYASTDSGTPQTTRTVIGSITVVRMPQGNGDINVDGKVDLADLILAQQIALGKIAPTAAQQAAGDVAPDGDPDGVIDAADIAWITQTILKLR